MSRFVAGLLGATIVGSGTYAYLTRFEADVTVAGKSDEVLLVGAVNLSIHRFTDDVGNSYKMLLTPWFWQFKPKELWIGLEVGKRYHIKGYGGFRSTPYYIGPNVYSAEPVDKV